MKETYTNLDNETSIISVPNKKNISFEILKYLNSKKNDDDFHDVSKIFINEKYIIDKYARGLAGNMYVATTRVKGIGNRALTKRDDPNDINDSNCKITAKGIEYYENSIKNKKAERMAIISLIIVSLGFLLSAFQYFNLI